MAQGSVCFIDYVEKLHPVRKLLERVGYEVKVLEKSDSDNWMNPALNADAIIVYHTSLPPESIAQLQKCKVIVCIGVTYEDNIAIITAYKKGIAVSNIPPYTIINERRALLQTSMETLRGLSGMPLQNKYIERGV
ncbi:MAG: hypothetical protein EPN39_05065 [Chitinophagaceae bacterium]|nr:MAG: hypothetical protein EPN39_05065 [Chitinophagaceae bacterium]